jgi:hypothetical protein
MKIHYCFAILFAVLAVVLGLASIFVATFGSNLLFAYCFAVLGVISLLLFWNAINSIADSL